MDTMSENDFLSGTPNVRFAKVTAVETTARYEGPLFKNVKSMREKTGRIFVFHRTIMNL